MRGLSRHPSGPLPPVDVLEAGRVDARRLLRPPPSGGFPPPGLLTPLLAAATAAHETAAPRGGSRRGPSVPPPWPASGAATVWRIPSRLSAGAVAMARVSWCEANSSCSTGDTTPTAGVRRPRL